MYISHLQNRPLTWSTAVLFLTTVLAASLGSAQDTDVSATATASTATEAAVEPPAITVSGADFQATLRRNETTLKLVNAAQLRYRFVFRPYVAALYLPEGADPKRYEQDIAKAIHIHYLWDLTAEDIGPAGQQVVARTHSETEMAGLQERLDRFDAAYQDVAPGDTYTLFYVPDEGTTLALNGRALVTIPGADFAAAYFSVWLGADPVEKKLRRDLMRWRKE